MILLVRVALPLNITTTITTTALSNNTTNAAAPSYAPWPYVSMNVRTADLFCSRTKTRRPHNNDLRAAPCPPADVLRSIRFPHSWFRFASIETKGPFSVCSLRFSPRNNRSRCFEVVRVCFARARALKASLKRWSRRCLSRVNSPLYFVCFNVRLDAAAVSEDDRSFSPDNDGWRGHHRGRSEKARVECTHKRLSVKCAPSVCPSVCRP